MCRVQCVQLEYGVCRVQCVQLEFGVCRVRCVQGTVCARAVSDIFCMQGSSFGLILPKLQQADHSIARYEELDIYEERALACGCLMGWAISKETLDLFISRLFGGSCHQKHREAIVIKTASPARI